MATHLFKEGRHSFYNDSATVLTGCNRVLFSLSIGNRSE